MRIIFYINYNVTFNATGNKSLLGATMNIGGNLTLLGYNSFSNGNLNVYGDVIVNSVDPGFSMSGSIVVTLKGNDSGQTISSASEWSTIPNLVIDTNNVAVNGNLQILTVGTLTANNAFVNMNGKNLSANSVSLSTASITKNAYQNKIYKFLAMYSHKGIRLVTPDD